MPIRFSTPVPITPADARIDYSSALISLGSCFAANMAQKFGYFQFRHTVNPFGIVFHPLAIGKMLDRAMDARAFSESDVFYHDGLWRCFDAHSETSHAERDTLMARLDEANSQLAHQLKNGTHCIITLGTAWIYRHLASGEPVANCHKVPQKFFSKELLSVIDIESSLRRILALLEAANPGLQIIFTVSPVRHLKDGFAENQRSKSHLIAALHSVLPGHANAHYFPAYEIMMDELRDYRFYAEDLVHPSAVAVDYIWQQFAAGWISGPATALMDEVDQIRKSLAHRPLHEGSPQFVKFRERLDQCIAALRQQLPHLVFD